MRFFAFALLMSLAVASPAQEKKSDKKPKAEKKASSQDWGRFNSGGNKALEKEKAKKDAAKAKK